MKFYKTVCHSQSPCSSSVLCVFRALSRSQSPPCIPVISCAGSRYQRPSRQRRCRDEPSRSSFNRRLSPCKSFHRLPSYLHSRFEPCSLIHSLRGLSGGVPRRSAIVTGGSASKTVVHRAETFLEHVLAYSLSVTSLSNIPTCARASLRRNGSMWLDH